MNKAINKTKDAVDKFDGKINITTPSVGNIIYNKKYLNCVILSWYKKIFRHKNKIKLYLANSEGWNENILIFIHLVVLILTSPKIAGKIRNNNSPNEMNNKTEERLVKYL